MLGKYIFLYHVLFMVIAFPFHGLPMKQADFNQVQSWPDNQNKIDTLLKLAKSHWYQNPRQSIETAKYALEISLLEKYQKKQADAYNVIGVAYYFLEEIDSATHYYNQSLELGRTLEYSEGIARVTNNMGLIHKLLGNYDKAIDYYYQSLEIEQENNNSEGIASTYLNIGNIYYYLNEYDKALEFMTNSLRINQQDKNENGILKCYTNIGSTYSEIGIYESALTYSEKALELSREMHNPDEEAANLNNIGKIYYDLKKYPKSINYFILALKIERKYEDLWSQANTLRNIGGVLFEQGNHENAKKYFEESLEIAKKIEAKSLLKELYYDFYLFYEVRQNFLKALHFHKIYTNLNDSLFGENKRIEIARIESSFRLKYKDQQLEIIRKENDVKNLTIKTQRYAIYITTFLGLLVFSLVFIFYNRAKTNKKAKTLLQSTNDIISEQKHLLEQTILQLKESEEKYKALTSSIQDGLIIIQDKKLIFINDAMCRILGYENEQEVLSLKPEEIIFKNDFTKVLKNYEARISGKDVPKNYTIKVNHKSGKSFEVSIRVNLIQLQGKPAIIGTIKDISKARNYENQLIRAKEKAEKATLSKSLFLAGMSHEIRNHMNSIIGITDVLDDTKLNEDQKNYVEIIKNSGNTLLSILNDILDLSKIEAGQVTLDLHEFNLKTIITEVISLHKLKAGTQNLFVKSEIAEDIPDTLEGDSTRLSQIIINLVGNALKFTDEGGVKIKIESLKKSKQEVWLKFNVIDTGIGVSIDSQEKLFKPFSQTHAAVERELGGSGLGLVISKHLVKLLGGEMGVDSSLGKGSNFWFTAKFKTGSRNKKTTSDKSYANTVNNKILLVEDNLLNQHLTTSILGREGYEADIASNGQEGVKLFKKKFYSVILMDIQMPVMDGIEATSLIRDYELKNYNTKSTIIAITAHSKEGDEQKLMDAGIDFYLRKPFKPDELLNFIRKLRN